MEKKINLLYIFGVKSIISNDIYGTIYKFITNNNEKLYIFLKDYDKIQTSCSSLVEFI